VSSAAIPDTQLDPQEDRAGEAADQAAGLRHSCFLGMVLQSDWAQVQVIELRNDGSGFGFGISGSRNSGAVVRNIFPGGAADQEGHLRNGDHLLQVGDVRLWGMGAQQVASILRAAGQECIRLVVARPVDPADPNQPMNCVIVPTKALADPAELDRALATSLSSGFAAAGALHHQPVFQGVANQMIAASPSLSQMLGRVPGAAVPGATPLSALPGTTSLGAVTGVMPLSAMSGQIVTGAQTAQPGHFNPTMKPVLNNLGGTSVQGNQASLGAFVNSRGKQSLSGVNAQLGSDPSGLSPVISNKGLSSDPNSAQLSVTSTSVISIQPAPAGLMRSSSLTSGSCARTSLSTVMSSKSGDPIAYSGTVEGIAEPVEVCSSGKSFKPNSPKMDRTSGQEYRTNPTKCSLPKSVSSPVTLVPGSSVSSSSLSSDPTNSTSRNSKGIPVILKCSGDGRTVTVKQFASKESVCSISEQTGVCDSDIEQSLPSLASPGWRGEASVIPGQAGETSDTMSTSSMAEQPATLTHQSGSQSGTMSFQSPEDYQETGFPGPEDKRPVKKTIGLQAALSLSPNSLALEEPPAAFTHSVCPSPGSVSCCSRTRTFAYSEGESADSCEEQRHVFEVDLEKDENGLGLTVAGYICEKESLCGIFVKKVVPGSVADQQGRILPNDQVIEVDGMELSGYCNQEAVELLKLTGKIVRLKICRYLRGLKFEQLQEGAIYRRPDGQVSQEVYCSMSSGSELDRPASTPSERDGDLLSHNLPTQISRNSSVASRSLGLSMLSPLMADSLSSQDQAFETGSLDLYPSPGSSQAMQSQSSRDVISSSSSQNVYKTFSKTNNSMEDCLQDKDEGIEMKDIVFDQESILDDLHVEKCIMTVSAGYPGKNNSPMVELTPLPSLPHEIASIGSRSSQSPPQISRPRTATGSVDSSSFDRVEVVSSEILTEDGTNSGRNAGAPKQQNIQPRDDTVLHRNTSTKRKAESETLVLSYDKRNSIRYSNSHSPSQSSRHSTHDRTEQVELRESSSSRTLGSVGRTQSQECRTSQTRGGRKTPVLKTGDLSGSQKYLEDGKDSDIDCYKGELCEALKDLAALDPEVIESKAGVTSQNENAREDSSSSSQGTDMVGIAPDVRKRLENKWEKILGPKYKIIVARLTKRAPGGGLGISLEGTVDVEEGVEVRPHHYIRSILPVGPVGATGKFWNGDQLLEVNGIALTGMYHEEVVKTLKELGVFVVLVCGRRVCGPSPLHGTIVNNVEIDCSKQAFNTRKILCGSLQSLLNAKDACQESVPLMKAKSEISLAISPAPNSITPSLSSISGPPPRSKSLEAFSNPAMWGPDVEEVILRKGEKGLGFSILDYQDPTNLTDTVIVVRGLVPGGAAQQDGRIIPGDRIMYVNATKLAGATLDMAVQALKGAPLGTVKIGICKPTNLDTNQKPKVQGGGCMSGSTAASSDLQTDTPTLSCSSVSIEEFSPIPSVLQGAFMGNPIIPSDLNRGQLSPVTGCPILPQFPKYAIRINKQASESIGMAVEALAWQLSGCLVREIDPHGALARDGRIKTGDLVLAVNYESIWRVTSSQAKTILRRADLMSGEIPLIFIPEEELIEEEELTTPEFGDINTEFGSQAVLNPVDTETEPDLTDLETEDTENNDDQANSGSFRLSDIQEQLEESESLCSNSFLASSPSCHSGILAPDFTVQSVNQPCRFSNLRLEDLPESRVDNSPEQSSSDPFVSSVLQRERNSSFSESQSSRTPSPHVSSSELGRSKTSPKATETSTFGGSIEKLVETKTDLTSAGFLAKQQSRRLSESEISEKLPPEPDSQGKRSPTGSLQFEGETFSQCSESFPTPPLSPQGSQLHNAEEREQNWIIREEVKEALSENNPTLKTQSNGSINSNQLNKSPQVHHSQLESEIKPSGLALEDLRLQQYERKLPQPDDAPKCDVLELGNTVKTELESKFSLVTSASLEEKPYREFDKLSRMTTRQSSLNLSNKNNSHDDLPSPSVGVSAKFWGPKRLVEVFREQGQPLGIAIVGGKVDMAGQSGQPGDSVTGIFIKNVLANSPAGRTGELATGDRIVEVDGVKLRSSDHELAVKAIQGAGNPIRFIVQSLQHWTGRDVKNNQDKKLSQPNKMMSMDAGSLVKSPSKLIIPDIFCVSPRPVNGPTVNGLSTSSSIRSDSSQSSAQNHTNMSSILEPEFNERRHSESVVKSRLSQQGLAQIGRPKSETHSTVNPAIPLIDEDEKPSLNGNPFLDDRLPVWQDDSSSVLSSPEGVQSYNYKQVPEVPSTPELQEMRKTSNNGGVHIVHSGEGNDFSSFRSNVSGQSSCPPTPVLIQKGLSDGEKQIIYNRIEAAQNQTTKPKAEEGGTARQKSDNVEECVLADGQLMGRADYQRKSSIENIEAGDEISDEEDEMEEDNWGNLQGEIISVTLEQNNYGLGLSLAGHKDRETMRTYICGIHPRGMAHQSGLLKAGDQLLKVGDHVVWDRCHLNVTTIIKNMSSQEKIGLTVLRDGKSLEQVSVKPVTHYPLLLDDMIFESQEFHKFKAKRELRVHKGKQGLGIMIIEGSHKATGSGIFVSDIQEKSAAFHSGLKVGDMILAINTETFLMISYDEAVSIIKSLGGNVKMLVTNPKEEEKCQNEPDAKPALMPRRESVTPSPAKVAKASPTTQPKTPAKPAEKAPAKAEEKAVAKPKEDDTKVEIVKDASGLGLSIVGGGDTPLGGVFIHEIHAGGPAEKGAKLKAGDQIVKVNDVDFRTLTHKEALNALRSAQDKVVLHFERKEDRAPENVYQDILVTLVKKSGKGLGLSVVGRRDGPGVFISALVSGGVADTNGQLLHGDQIMKVNESDLSNSTQDAAVAILKMANGDVKLVVRRLKILTK